MREVGEAAEPLHDLELLGANLDPVRERGERQRGAGRGCPAVERGVRFVEASVVDLQRRERRSFGPETACKRCALARTIPVPIRWKFATSIRCRIDS